MKKITFLTLLVAVVFLFGSCSIVQKNGKTKDKAATEQAPAMEEDSEE